LKLAVVSEWDFQTPHEWSGTPYFMATAASEVLGASFFLTHPRFDRLSGTVDQRLRTIGAYVSSRVAEEAADVVLFQGTAAVPHCEGSFQRVVWHDSTWFALMSQKGVSFSEFCAHWPALHHWDLGVFANANKIFYTSEWARATAINNYGIPPEQTDVLPYGANLASAPTASEIASIIHGRSRDVCRLLFVGKDWRRKGLTRAVDVVTTLNRQGVRATLAVIGVPKKAAPIESEFVDYVGILDKSSADDQKTYARYLHDSHFLIHPASFECFGIVVAEARAYGVPSVATRVAGLASAIQDGVNGRLLALDDFPETAARVIAEIFRDPQQYQRFALAAFDSFRSRYNWRSLVTELGDRLRNVPA
jgi:glycosyltransferase involved in cell wall biosynthesis